MRSDLAPPASVRACFRPRLESPHAGARRRCSGAVCRPPKMSDECLNSCLHLGLRSLKQSVADSSPAMLYQTFGASLHHSTGVAPARRHTEPASPKQMRRSAVLPMSQFACDSESVLSNCGLLVRASLRCLLCQAEVQCQDVLDLRSTRCHHQTFPGGISVGLLFCFHCRFKNVKGPAPHIPSDVLAD